MQFTNTNNCLEFDVHTTPFHVYKVELSLANTVYNCKNKDV